MKTNTSFFLLMLAPVLSFCQLSVTAKAGINADFFKDLNYYPLSIDGKLSHQHKPGLQVGAALNFKLNDILYLNTELLYNKRTYRVVESYPTNQTTFQYDRDFQVSWHYIDLQLLIKARIYKNLFVELGPSLSYLLSADFKINASQPVIPVTGNQRKYYSGFDAGINTGASYEFKQVGVGFRYSYSLNDTKVKKNYSDPEFGYESLLPYGRHRNLHIYVSYKLKHQ